MPLVKLALQPIGAEVRIPKEGSTTEFYDFVVVHHGKPSDIYDSSWNNGTILFSKKVLETGTYADIDTYLNNTLLPSLSVGVKNHIKSVVLPENTNSDLCSLFIPSRKETGNFQTEIGSNFDYFVDEAYDTVSLCNAKRKANNLAGVAADWWMRNTKNITQPYVVTTNGGTSTYKQTTSHGIRPALVLHSSIAVSDNGVITSTLLSNNIVQLKDLPIGAKVKDEGTCLYGSPITMQLGAVNHPGYPAKSATLVSEKIIRFITWTATKTLVYGSSDIRHYLNSDGLDWLIGTAEPEYKHEAGFLTYFSAQLKEKLMPTELPSFAYGGGGMTYSLDKVFLLSQAEAFNEPRNGSSVLLGNPDYEGSVLPLFSEQGYGFREPTKKALQNSLFTETASFTTEKGRKWWLRGSKYATGGSSGTVVNYISIGDTDGLFSSGSSLNEPARNAKDIGLVIAYNIPNDIMISDTPDEYGVFSMVWNEPPEINHTGPSALGNKTEGFAVNYSISDENGDPVTVTEKLDGIVRRTYTPQLDAPQSFQAVLPQNFLTVLNGEHVLTIEVNDGKAAAEPVNITFKKTVYGAALTLDEPVVTDDRLASIKLPITGYIPPDAIISILVSNNALDAVPVWEDATAALMNGYSHVFVNEQKTADDWGVNFKIEIQRGPSGEGGYIYIVEGWI